MGFVAPIVSAVGGLLSSPVVGGILGAGSLISGIANQRRESRAAEAYYNDQRRSILNQEAEAKKLKEEADKRKRQQEQFQQEAARVEAMRAARIQQRELRGRRRGWFDDSYYGSLADLMG